MAVHSKYCGVLPVSMEGFDRKVIEVCCPKSMFIWGLLRHTRNDGHLIQLTMCVDLLLHMYAYMYVRMYSMYARTVCTHVYIRMSLTHYAKHTNMMLTHLSEYLSKTQSPCTTHNYIGMSL